MIKVLLIEDNKLALDYLKNLIDWESCGFKIVATAIDGEEGLKRYLRFRPQLIITDIQMPVLSGIEVAKRVREGDKDVKIIFLSSYQEFDYVRAALNFGVSDYIMKHELNEQSLIKKLAEMKALIYEGRTFRNLRNEFSITENILRAPSIERPCCEVGGLKNNRYSLMLIERDHPLEIALDILPMSLPLLEESAVKQVCYRLDEQMSGVVRIKGDLYLLLILVSDRSKVVNEFGYEIKGLFETHFGRSFSIFVIGENLEFGECRERYNIYKDIINYRYFTKTSVVVNSILFEASMCSEEVHFEPNLIQGALKKGDIDSIHKFIDTSFIKIIGNRDYQALSSITHYLFNILKAYDGEIVRLRDCKQFTLFREMDENRLYTAKGIADLLKEKFTELCDLLYNNKENECSNAVKAVIRYISKNYQNVNLSMENIAEHVNLSVSRIGNVFKKETGHSLRGYINWYRIEKSKKLIEAGLKMYQIHSEVGYLTSQYFSKVFRKVTGMTPMEYKRGDKYEAIL